MNAAIFTVLYDPQISDQHLDYFQRTDSKN